MRKKLLIIASLGIIALVLTCQKLDFDLITKIKTTSAITGLDNIQAQCEILELSSNNHTEFGFCYGTSPMPTVDDSKSVIGAPQVGVFTQKILGLASDTKYYLRSFCKDGDTYVYGEVVEAKTSVVTLTDVDNNTYNGVSIGTQVWMQENLKVAHYRNGDVIANITDNSTWSNLTIGAYCLYDNKAENKNIYGALYNFYTVVDDRNVCPTGWHIPTDAEWATLGDYLGGEDIAGGKMKEYGLTHWIKPNVDASNSSGFTAFPGGYRDKDGTYNSFGEEGKWWSKTANDATTSIFRYIYNNYATLFKENFGKGSGLSIRCIKGEIAALPSITTTAITDVTTSTAASGGNITSDGYSNVTARGVCWSTSQNPTVSLTTKTVDGAGTGVFTSNLTNLSPNTKYYVRAYATNSVGTAYGTEVNFTTSAATLTVTDYDGNIYNTVTIGTQIWTKENLRVTHYRNGDAIDNITDNTAWSTQTTGAYCWYNNDQATYKATYGALYNYYTAVDSRNLCPTGWRVPTDTEWTTLETYLGGSSVAGGKLKSTTLWVSPNTGADNSSGFTAFPGGARSNIGGSFDALGNYAYWWTLNEYDTDNGWSRSLVNSTLIISRHSSYKTNGYSVRCLQGEGQVLPTIITTAATAVTSVTATSGGNVTSDGGATLIERGICYNTSHNPTITDTKVIATGTNGSFSSSITGLTPNTTYYLRAYATNSVGTAYGSEVNFTTGIAIGDNYQGGKVAYILQSGDPGFVAGQIHGLIAALSDQSSGVNWGCDGTTISGADGTALGTGLQNTLDIMAGCSTDGIAARLCRGVTINGYNDWYLPSKDELNLLYLNKDAIGGFVIGGYYGSTEYDSNFAWGQSIIGINSGIQGGFSKGNTFHVRAVRSF